MDPLAIGGLGILALFALMLLQVPIGFAMIIVGVVGFALQAGWKPALAQLVNDPAGVLASADLATVPLFLLMGTFASVAGFSTDIYNLAAAFLGHRRGGLGYATVGGSAAFGVVCGSSTAAAATFARAALPEMLKRGYSPAFSTGAIAAGGTLKSLIPPSIVMILYCIVVQRVSIIDLFVAAIIPALLTVAFNLAAVAVIARRSPASAPLGPRVAWRERWKSLRAAAPVLVLMFAVFGGLYSGVFTVTEAASVAAVLSLLFALLRGRLNWSMVLRGLRESAAATAMIYMIIIGAQVFTYFITLAHVPEAMVKSIEALHLSPLAIVALLLVVYIVLGTVFEEISAILITLPFVLPLVQKVGQDLMPGFSPELIAIWWGIICVIQAELAMIHPPFGIIVFLLHGLAPQIPMGTIYRGVVPFIVADLAVLVLLTLFPILAIWPLTLGAR